MRRRSKTEQRRRVLRLAELYGKAVERWSKVYDGVEKVRGLNALHPKHTAWERRLYRADLAKARWRASLLRAAQELATGRRSRD